MRAAAAATKAVRMLDLLTEFFENDAEGKRGLVSALPHLRKLHHIHGDATGKYLRQAICRTFSPAVLRELHHRPISLEETRAVIERARRLALADAEPAAARPASRPSLPRRFAKIFWPPAAN